MGKQVQITIIVLLLIKASVAQVYDLDPVRHSNFETNPACLANSKSVFAAGFLHQGSAYQKNKFYSDAIRLSFYNRNYFTGIGITVNNTNMNDSSGYRYIGIGAAYRSIMFNKIYAKLGVMYKLMSYTSVPGYFDLYSFNRTNEGGIKNRMNDNANVSLSFSSSEDKYYVSGGALNLQPWRTTDTNFAFPQYYFVNVGDFCKMFNSLNWEFSYTAIAKKYSGKNILPVSHYVTLAYKGFNLSRNSKILYGLRAGWADETFIRVNPSVSFYRRISGNKYQNHYRPAKNILFQIMFDVGYNPQLNNMPYKPNIQFNLNYSL